MPGVQMTGVLVVVGQRYPAGHTKHVPPPSTEYVPEEQAPVMATKLHALPAGHGVQYKTPVAPATPVRSGA